MSISDSIVSLTSGINSGKIYPQNAPQDTDYPYAVYTFISDVPTDDKDGPSALDTWRLQISIWGDGATVQTLLASYRSTLDRYRGSNSGNNIDKIIFAGINDLFSEDSRYTGKAIDFLIRVKL